MDNDETADEETMAELKEDIKSEISKFNADLIPDDSPHCADYAISFIHVRSDFYTWKNKAKNFLTYEWLGTSKTENLKVDELDWRHRVIFCQNRNAFRNIVARKSDISKNKDLRIPFYFNGYYFITVLV